jgi:hypothetical protein
MENSKTAVAVYREKTAQFFNLFKIFFGSVVDGKFNECVCAC